MKRMEQILEGGSMSCMIDPKLMTIEEEIQKIYGPMDTQSEHFKKLMKAFQEQNMETNIVMHQKEDKMRGTYIEHFSNLNLKKNIYWRKII